jgi:hypothetical protein
MVPMERGERALVLVVRDKAADDPGLSAAEAARRATALALGAAGLALEIVRAILNRSGPTGPEVRAPRSSEPPRPLQQLPGAALGLGLEAQRQSLDLAAALGARLWPPLRSVAGPVASIARAPLGAAWRRLDVEGWAARGLAEQHRNRQAATEAARALVGAVTAAVLDQVDLDGVVARVDLDRIVDRLDIDQIAERVDVDAIAARIDLDAVIARVDVEGVVARVDLPGLAERVMSEVDVSEIIRESSSTMATETVDTLRVQGMRADRLLSRTVDRVLGRREERQTDAGLAGRDEGANSPPSDEAGPTPSAP